MFLINFKFLFQQATEKSDDVKSSDESVEEIVRFLVSETTQTEGGFAYNCIVLLSCCFFRSTVKFYYSSNRIGAQGGNSTLICVLLYSLSVIIQQTQTVFESSEVHSQTSAAEFYSNTAVQIDAAETTDQVTI